MLTINQGAIIKFEANNYVRVSATGTLNAIGGPTNPIVFTSIKDDAHGGDTNGDGSATSPKAGDWGGIQLQGTNNSTLSECAFEYQGSSNGAVVDSSPAPVTVTNSVFAHNRPTTDAITSAPALDLSGAPAGNVVQGNIFYDNGVPIGINGNFSLDDTNSFDNSAAAPSNPQPNEYNGIVVSTGPNIDGHISWGTTKVPYVLTDSYLEIDSTGTLSLADGVTVKFSSGTSFNVAGVLSSPGSSGIVLTSIKDDAHGGDTNGDGSATTPTAGDWDGVTLANSTGSHFNKTGFYYAGGDSHAALNVGGTAAMITNCTFAHDQNTTDSITALAALDASSAPAATQITGNLFYDDRVPLGINPLISIDDSNSFDNSAAAPSNPQPSEYNGIVVNNVGPDLDGMVSWKATKVPFAIAPYLVINSTGTLTLGNNVTLKFYAASNSGILVEQGGVVSAGTGDILTSIRDDAHGGDTNGDGAATAPAAGDWWGIAGNGTSGLGSSDSPLTCQTVGTQYYATCN